MTVGDGANGLSSGPPRARYNVARLLIIGLVFHLIYIGSVFDCYFTSPVVNGMRSYKTGSAESKRLVLIVGDGLRADLLFNRKPFPSIPWSPEIVAPHLRSIAETRGAFGISHTRVPTESRPGHVAIIGGMYEDVSAVTKGWKTNPVDFDSVFNQSTTTFSFGSPDILPMFARGATPGKVKTWTYSEELEDFTKDATELDVWVLDQLRTLFDNAASDPELDAQLRSDKVVFFLHLLGLDTTGHSYRPHSKEYMRNIELVDDIVRQTEELFSKFYNDQETSFIFTADHGMSIIGNHGDGHPDNTRTPLIAWGKGIRGPLPDSSPSSHDDYSSPWDLGHLYRRDVEQADIASLMAALIGINWPVNSVGVLPDVDPTRPGYLDPERGDETRARAALVNAKVILEHYRLKHELKHAHTLFYKPFKTLEGSSASGQPLRIATVQFIEDLITKKDWNQSRAASAELIQTALAGLHYLQTYDRLLIRVIVTLAYLGWAAYASLYILRPLDVADPGASMSSSSATIVTSIAIGIVTAFWGLFALQKSPWTFYLYVLFPSYFWRQVLVQAGPAICRWTASESRSRDEIIRLLVRAALVVGFLQGMVLGYTQRSVWSAGFLLIGVVWPFFWTPEMHKRSSLLRWDWGVVCAISAVFPLLPVDKKESITIIVVGGTVMHVASYMFTFKHEEIMKNFRMIYVYAVQTVLIVATMCVTIISTYCLNEKLGLPFFAQVSGWVVLILSAFTPYFWFKNAKQSPSVNANAKLLLYFLAFCPCFIILSIREEGLFYIAYSATMIVWIEVERAVRAAGRENKEQNGGVVAKGATRSYEFQPDDLRIALFFLFLVQVGFFGIGNVASISSFYLAPVYRLIPVFSPFFMAALLIYKIVAPYIMLSVTFAVMNHALRLPPFSLLLVALTLTDGMTLTFFFNVQDTGSWLEIGQSITFFCISSLLLLWSAAICAAGEYLMADIFATPLDKNDVKVQ